METRSSCRRRLGSGPFLFYFAFVLTSATFHFVATTPVIPHRPRIINFTTNTNGTNSNRTHSPRANKWPFGTEIRWQRVQPASAVTNDVPKAPTNSAPPPFVDKSSTFTPAKPCNQEKCKLPNCFCGGGIPGGLKRENTPQMVMITFDDSVNEINFPFYQELFNKNRTNPNGCPIKGTFYVSHEWTDYSKIQKLYSDGHEIASHSISHSMGAASFTTERWWKEIEGERRILKRLANVEAADVKGMRAPYLQPGGDRQFGMLQSAGFTYDSSLTTGDPSTWPYTLETAMIHRCQLPPCPERSFPGIWEVPLAMLVGSNGRPCSMADSCVYPNTTEGVAKVLKKNFDTRYNGNRAPLGLYFHYAWFTIDHHREGFISFIDSILGRKDVFFLTTSQVLDWIRQPTNLKDTPSFTPWSCRQSRVHSFSNCVKPNSCVLRFGHQQRYLFTCADCPKNFPWIDNFSGD